MLAAALCLAAFAVACVTPLPRPGGEPTPTSPPATAMPTPVVAAPTATLAVAIPPAPTAAPPTPVATVPPTPTEALPTAVPTEEGVAPALQIFAPEDGATVPGNSVVVYGQTAVGARVFIAGEETEVDAQGGFRLEVALAPAGNEVVIVAQSEAGQRREITRRVTSLALPFLLLVVEPENESIVSTPNLPLSGRTGPNAIVSINGRSVPVDRFGYFSSTVQLEEGPNIIDVVATNDDGQSLSSVLAVIYRSPGG